MSNRKGRPEARLATPTGPLECVSFAWASSMLRIGTLVVLWFATGCALVGTPLYTKESGVRSDQKGWIKEDLALILARYFAAASRRDGRVVDVQLVADMNKVLQICFRHGSCDGADIDGGVRAMNFFRKAYFEAEGDYWTWREAVRDRQRKPYGEDDPFYPSLIPRGYK